jgi:hypothetical protein
MKKEKIKKALELIIEQTKHELALAEHEDYQVDKCLMINKAVEIVLNDDVGRYLLV